MSPRKPFKWWLPPHTQNYPIGIDTCWAFEAFSALTSNPLEMLKTRQVCPTNRPRYLRDISCIPDSQRQKKKTILMPLATATADSKHGLSHKPHHRFPSSEPAAYFAKVRTELQLWTANDVNVNVQYAFPLAVVTSWHMWEAMSNTDSRETCTQKRTL